MKNNRLIFGIKDLVLVTAAIGGILAFYERYDLGRRDGVQIGYTDGLRVGRSDGYTIAFQEGFETGCSHTQDFWYHTDKDSYRRFFIDEGSIGMMWEQYPIYHYHEFGKTLEEIREMQKRRFLDSENRNLKELAEN